jgi:acetyl esterase/lipase
LRHIEDAANREHGLASIGRRTMTFQRIFGMAGFALILAAQVFAQQQNSYEVSGLEIRRDVTYGTHDGVALLGDYYIPKAPGKYPVMIAVHGGAWQTGSKDPYRFWGSYLVQHGIALFAIDYRLSKPGQPTYPRAVADVRAAVQFVKSKAGELKADPERVGMMGDSAGAHLSALIALSPDAAPGSNLYPADPYASVSARVKVVVGAYGVYDMAQQWIHDQVTRPRDQITEKFLGKPPMDDRRLFFDASPLSYVIRGNNQTSFFLTWGTVDDIVDPAQSEAFLLALKQAGFYVRTQQVIAAPHYWFTDPMDEPRGNIGFVAPQVLRFLAERL